MIDWLITLVVVASFFAVMCGLGLLIHDMIRPLDDSDEHCSQVDDDLTEREAEILQFPRSRAFAGRTAFAPTDDAA